MIPNQQSPNQQIKQEQNPMYYPQLGFKQMTVYSNNYNSQISPMIVYQTVPIPNNQNTMQHVRSEQIEGNEQNVEDIQIHQQKKKEKNRRNKPKIDPGLNDSSLNTTNGQIKTTNRNRSKNLKKKECSQIPPPVSSLNMPFQDESNYNQTKNIQVNSINNSTDKNCPINSGNKSNNIGESAKHEVKKSKSSHDLKEILGIVPYSDNDRQFCFACKFSDSEQTEFISNKEMRKRYPAQLIKFYEIHVEAVYTQQPYSKG